MSECEKLISKSGLCSLLGISMSTLNRILKKQKNFPIYYISGSIRFKYSEVLEYLQKSKNEVDKK